MMYDHRTNTCYAPTEHVPYTCHFLSDAEDDFPSIPKTSPILGLEAGHSKRNLATARKARPPSLPKGNHQQQVSR